MMPLASGRVPFPDGVAFAALHFCSQIVGTGDIRHAQQLVRTAGHLKALRAGRRFHRSEARFCDVSEAPDEVVVLRDHDGLRLRGAALRVWSRLNDPVALDELVKSAIAQGATPDGALSSIGGLLLTLLRWQLVEVESDAGRCRFLGLRRRH
jgi:hypothetical protein